MVAASLEADPDARHDSQEHLDSTPSPRQETGAESTIVFHAPIARNRVRFLGGCVGGVYRASND